MRLRERYFAGTLLLTLASPGPHAVRGQGDPSPALQDTSGFVVTSEIAQVNGIAMRYLRAGRGEPLVLLHGWPQHSLMWRRILPVLAARHTVIAPDLRGAGGSSITPAGYDKRTMAEDVHQLLRQLGFERIDLVGYDKGAGVAYAYASAHPEQVRRLVFMEYALPGFGVWEKGITPSPEWNDGSNWHAAWFTLPDVAEKFIGGQERDLLTWFFWHLSCDPGAVRPADFEEYVRQISKPGALRAGMRYYAAVWTDGEHNRENARRKLTMPVLAVGGQCSGGEYIAQFLQRVATDVRPAVVHGAGHWLLEEQPDAVAALLLQFLGTP